MLNRTRKRYRRKRISTCSHSHSCLLLSSSSRQLPRGLHRKTPANKTATIVTVERYTIDGATREFATVCSFRVNFGDMFPFSLNRFGGAPKWLFCLLNPGVTGWIVDAAFTDFLGLQYYIDGTLSIWLLVESVRNKEHGILLDKYNIIVLWGGGLTLNKGTDFSCYLHEKKKKNIMIRTRISQLTDFQRRKGTIETDWKWDFVRGYLYHSGAKRSHLVCGHAQRARGCCEECPIVNSIVSGHLNQSTFHL